MQLDHLQSFLAVLRQGSFTGAAEALGCSQSTVSAHLAALEGELGTRLLDRGRSGVRLTHAGRRLRPRARRLLELAEETRSAVGARVQESLSLEASTIPATCLLPPVLAQLRSEQPALSVEMRVSDSRQALRALLDEACDLAVVGARPRDPGVLSRAIGGDRIVLVGRPTDPAPDGLDGLPLVVREAGSGTGQAAARLVPSEGPRVEVGSAEAVRRCVLAGLGYALVSELSVQEDLDAGRLRVLPLAGTPIERRFHVARLRRVTPGPATRRLWQLLVGRV